MLDEELGRLFTAAPMDALEDFRVISIDLHPFWPALEIAFVLVQLPSQEKRYRRLRMTMEAGEALVQALTAAIARSKTQTQPGPMS